MKVGDKVKVVRAESLTGEPFVGRAGTLMSVTNGVKYAYRVLFEGSGRLYNFTMSELELLTPDPEVKIETLANGRFFASHVNGTVSVGEYSLGRKKELLKSLSETIDALEEAIRKRDGIRDVDRGRVALELFGKRYEVLGNKQKKAVDLYREAESE